MAKWGEGDPRWIVEERPDATNVNNWHLTEKNADHWSKAKIKVWRLLIMVRVMLTKNICRNCSHRVPEGPTTGRGS